MLIRIVAIAVIALLLTGCKNELYGNLSENDANEIVAILLSNGLDSEKASAKKGQFAILVDQSQMARAVQLLKEYGYPKEQFEDMGDVFKKEGLISSPLEERGRYIYALSQNIQSMLSTIDGVLTARVNVVLPDNNPFAENVKPSSAAVFVKYHPESNAGDYKSEIKMMVSNSIEGLNYDQVSLMMLPAMTPPESSKPIPWKRALGLKLTDDSIGGFWLLVGALVLLVLAGTGASAYLWLQLRKLESQPGQLSRDAEAARPAPQPIDSLLKTVAG